MRDVGQASKATFAAAASFSTFAHISARAWETYGPG